MRISEAKIKEYVQIYDQYYGKYINTLNNRGKKPFKVFPARKAQVINDILDSMTFEQSNSLRLMCKYNSLTRASKVSSMSKERISKSYEIATRHMYEPKNIAMAVPVFYPKAPVVDDGSMTRLTKEDFGGSGYILSALQKKSNIYYREQLMKHLSMGWYYLWTLPGCGTGARMKILMAIDRWEGRN